MEAVKIHQGGPEAEGSPTCHPFGVQPPLYHADSVSSTFGHPARSPRWSSPLTCSEGLASSTFEGSEQEQEQEQPAEGWGTAAGQAKQNKPASDTVQFVVRYGYLAAWLAALFVGYALQRLWCVCGIPYDCKQKDYLDIFRDLTQLSLFGGALAWFVRGLEPQHFAWLFSRQRWYVWAVYFGLPPAYSGISNIPTFRHSMASFSDWSPGMIVIVAIAAALLLAALCMHLWLAKRGQRWLHLGMYLAPRAAVLLFFIGSALGLTLSGLADMHLHHVYIGWAIAIFAEFDHWASGLLLAVGAAVFVQGAGAYSFEAVFEAAGRLCINTKPAHLLDCSFSDMNDKFELRVCSRDGLTPLPELKCSMWPPALPTSSPAPQG